MIGGRLRVRPAGYVVGGPRLDIRPFRGRVVVAVCAREKEGEREWPKIRAEDHARRGHCIVNRGRFQRTYARNRAEQA